MKTFLILLASLALAGCSLDEVVAPIDTVDGRMDTVETREAIKATPTATPRPHKPETRIVYVEREKPETKVVVTIQDEQHDRVIPKHIIERTEIVLPTPAPDFNIERFARAVARVETNDCTTARFNNCYNLLLTAGHNDPVPAHFQSQEMSNMDFKGRWMKRYGRFPTYRDALEWKGNNLTSLSASEWLAAVKTEYEK